MGRLFSRALPCVVITVCAFCVACATRDGTPYDQNLRSSPLYKQLQATERIDGYRGINQIIESLTLERQKVEAAALWLRDAYIFRKNKNPRYGLMYSNSLQILANSARKADRESQYTGLQAGAIVAFYSSQLIALEDLARCRDQTGGLVYRMNWGGEYAKFYSAQYGSLDPIERDQLLAVILRLAATREISDPDLGACGSGIRATKRAMEAGQCRDANPGETIHSYGTTIICDAGQFAKLVTDVEWKERRLPLRKKFREMLIAIKP